MSMQDGYAASGVGGEYLQVWVPDFVKSDLELHNDEVSQIGHLVLWHREAAYTLRHEFSRVDLGDIAQSHLIVFNSHFDIAQSLSSASILLNCGLLADALTVLRPAVEHMIDLQYIRRYPDEAPHYDGKALAFLRRLLDEQAEPRMEDFARPFRFKNITTVVNHIDKSPDVSEMEKVMITQWRWLSNVAAHSSSMRVFMTRREATDWDHAVHHIGYTASLACEQIYNLDPDIRAIIDDSSGLTARYAGMVTAGIIRETSDG
jgi:hypothetical protein